MRGNIPSVTLSWTPLAGGHYPGCQGKGGGAVTGAAVGLVGLGFVSPFSGLAAVSSLLPRENLGQALELITGKRGAPRGLSWRAGGEDGRMCEETVELLLQKSSPLKKHHFFCSARIRAPPPQLKHTITGVRGEAESPLPASHFCWCPAVSWLPRSPRAHP